MKMRVGGWNRETMGAGGQAFKNNSTLGSHDKAGCLVL
jgi:hypothetical protein